MSGGDFELGRVRGTGITVKVDPVDRIPNYDPRSGEHLWLVLAAYRVKPADWVGRDAANANLDHENLVNITGPGCFYCERAYTAFLDGRRCPGHPA